MKSVSQTGAEAVPDFRALVKLLVLQHIFLFGYAGAQNRAALAAMQRLHSCSAGTAGAVASTDLKRDLNSIIPEIRHVDVSSSFCCCLR